MPIRLVTMGGPQWHPIDLDGLTIYMRFHSKDNVEFTDNPVLESARQFLFQGNFEWPNADTPSFKDISGETSDAFFRQHTDALDAIKAVVAFEAFRKQYPKGRDPVAWGGIDFFESLKAKNGGANWPLRLAIASSIYALMSTIVLTSLVLFLAGDGLSATASILKAVTGPRFEDSLAKYLRGGSYNDPLPPLWPVVFVAVSAAAIFPPVLLGMCGIQAANDNRSREKDLLGILRTHGVWTLNDGSPRVPGSFENTTALAAEKGYRPAQEVRDVLDWWLRREYADRQARSDMNNRLPCFRG